MLATKNTYERFDVLTLESTREIPGQTRLLEGMETLTRGVPADMLVGWGEDMRQAIDRAVDLLRVPAVLAAWALDTDELPLPVARSIPRDGFEKIASLNCEIAMLYRRSLTGEPEDAERWEDTAEQVRELGKAIRIWSTSKMTRDTIRSLRKFAERDVWEGFRHLIAAIAGFYGAGIENPIAPVWAVRLRLLEELLEIVRDAGPKGVESR